MTKKKIIKTVKNYKELCSVLGVKPSTNRVSQLKRLEKLADFKKINGKQAYEIYKIYETPKNQGLARESMQNYVQRLIIDLISQQPDKTISLTTNELLVAIGAVSSNYTYAKNNIREFSNRIKLNELLVNDYFYGNHGVHSMLKELIKRSIEGLKKSKWLLWEEEIWIAEKKCIPEKCGDNKYRIRTILEHHKATDKERKEILLSEREALTKVVEFYNSKHEDDTISVKKADKRWLYVHGLFPKYSEELKVELGLIATENLSNYDYFYKKHRLMACDRLVDMYKKYDDMEMNRNDRAKCKELLNSKIIESIITNCTNKHEKIIELNAIKRENDEYIYPIEVALEDFTYMVNINKLNKVVIFKNSRKLS